MATLGAVSPSALILDVICSGSDGKDMDSGLSREGLKWRQRRQGELVVYLQSTNFAPDFVQHFSGLDSGQVAFLIGHMIKPSSVITDLLFS